MVINVKVKPNSKETSISCTDSLYTVKLRSKPHEGKANTELISVLAKYFDIPRSCVRILKGAKAKVKVVEVDKE